jgi:hypothetical protein
VALLRLLGDGPVSWGFMPVILLLGGGLLISPNTRRFGVGLLIAGGIIGIVTAGVCGTLLA